MRSRFADSPEFRRLLACEPRVDLAAVALEIAADAYPDLSAAPYLEKLDRLADRIREHCPPGMKTRQILGQINWVLYVEEAFQGNVADYYDPRNSFMNEVIDRRTGIPITLSLLYLSIAERLGLAAGGLDLPAHFMIRIEAEAGPIFVDPFHGGELLGARGCRERLSAIVGRPLELGDEQLTPCGPHRIIARMLRNLKSIYLRAQELPMALAIQRRLAAVDTTVTAEQRDLGMLWMQLERPVEAIEPLQNYLERDPNAPDAEAVRELLRAARLAVAAWN